MKAEVFLEVLKKILVVWVFMAIVAFIAYKCEKQTEEHHWRCINMVVIQNQHQAVSDTIRNIVYHYNMSHEELNIFIALSTYQTMQIHDGDTTLITSSIETCGETICPE